MNKLNSLAKFLEVSKDELKESTWDKNTFTLGDQEYMILTNKEADKAAKEYILETAWAFNTWFIMDHLNAKFSKVECIEELIKEAQNKCESGNDFILNLVKKNDFVKDAVSYDGRGHFLSCYDGNENEQDSYFIYRTN